VPRSKFRQSDLHSPIDYAEESKPVVGRVVDSNHMLAAIPNMSPEQVASVRRHIRERMLDAEDGALLAEALGVRWRDVGDWPDDWPIDTDLE
jgi:hypothetical protein